MHTVIVNENDDVLVCGANGYGQLGLAIIIIKINHNIDAQYTNTTNHM